MSAADKARLDQKHAEAVALMEDYAARATKAVYDRDWSALDVCAYMLRFGAHALTEAEDAMRVPE